MQINRRLWPVPNLPKKYYRAFVIEIDNVTVWMIFKNGMCENIVRTPHGKTGTYHGELIKEWTNQNACLVREETI